MDYADLSRRHAEELDAADELAAYRDRFLVSDPALIYLDGNSLGRLSLAAKCRLERVVEEEWGARLIAGWNEGWYGAPLRIGDQIGELVGAEPGQIVVTDSTSVDLFKAVVAALQLRDGRSRVVTDVLNFPSDLYVIRGAIELLGDDRELLVVSSGDDGVTPDVGELLRSIDENTAVVSLSHAAFQSGYLYDMEAITTAAHEAGALVVWDLSHSVGVTPIELDRWGVDLAVGCTYKYLNGGPGSPAFLYVRRALHDSLLSPIWGWFGRREPFAFDAAYAPADGIARFLAGTPPVLSLLAIEAALEPLRDAGIARLRRKSVALTSYLVSLAQRRLVPFGFSVASPLDSARRGSHVSLRHRDGYRITQALIAEAKVVPDFRAPDLIRFGCAPIYTRFTELWDAVDRTCSLLARGRHEAYPSRPAGVT